MSIGLELVLKLSKCCVWDIPLKCIHETLEFINRRARNVLRISFHKLWDDRKLIVGEFSFEDITAHLTPAGGERVSIRVLQALS